MSAYTVGNEQPTHPSHLHLVLVSGIVVTNIDGFKKVAILKAKLDDSGDEFRPPNM